MSSKNENNHCQSPEGVNVRCHIKVYAIFLMTMISRESSAQFRVDFSDSLWSQIESVNSEKEPCYWISSREARLVYSFNDSTIELIDNCYSQVLGPSAVWSLNILLQSWSIAFRKGIDIGKIYLFNYLLVRKRPRCKIYNFNLSKLFSTKKT